MATTSRKVLVPLATLLAAGAVAIGSGATWTSTTGSSVAVTSGTLIHTNDHDGATLTLGDIKPGDSMSGTVTVANTGDVDSKLDLAVSGVSNSFSDFLTVSVTEGSTSLYSGPFSGLAAGFAQTDIDFNKGATVTYSFTVALDQGATNADQDEAAGASFTWTQTQVAGGSLVENWIG